MLTQIQLSKPSVAPVTLLDHWHLASLDAPTVAAVWTLSFAWAAHVRLPAWVPVLIVLAVWSVYVVDRILDARSGLRSGNLHRLRERHLFHWRHRGILLPLASAAAVAAACIIFTFMPVSTRQRDSFLAAASFLYFTRVHTGRSAAPLLSKEFIVGLLFTIGCVLPAFSRAASPFGLLIPAVIFALLAWLNCHAIECWETAFRLTDRHSITSCAIALAIAGVCLSAVLVFSQPRAAALMACASLAATLLVLLDRFRSRIPAVTLRAAADLALLTPVLLFPFAALFRR